MAELARFFVPGPYLIVLIFAVFDLIALLATARILSKNSEIIPQAKTSFAVIARAFTLAFKRRVAKEFPYLGSLNEKYRQYYSGSPCRKEYDKYESLINNTVAVTLALVCVLVIHLVFFYYDARDNNAFDLSQKVPSIVMASLTVIYFVFLLFALRKNAKDAKMFDSLVLKYEGARDRSSLTELSQVPLNRGDTMDSKVQKLGMGKFDLTAFLKFADSKIATPADADKLLERRQADFDSSRKKYEEMIKKK